MKLHSPKKILIFFLKEKIYCENYFNYHILYVKKIFNRKMIKNKFIIKYIICYYKMFDYV